MSQEREPATAPPEPSHPPDPPDAPDPPPTGTLVVDEVCGRVGEVMDVVGSRVRLRPVRGGREWEADPARVRTATTGERLRATLAAVNAASRGLPASPVVGDRAGAGVVVPGARGRRAGHGEGLSSGLGVPE